MTAHPDTQSIRINHALQWALESTDDPAMAAADWLARDIDPNASSAVALLTDPSVELNTLVRAKNVFKTLRIVGETAADRRMGARMYATAIAAALIRHNQWITRQSPAGVRRVIESICRDDTLPEELRSLAELAMCLPALRNGTDGLESV